MQLSVEHAQRMTDLKGQQESAGQVFKAAMAYYQQQTVEINAQLLICWKEIAASLGLNFNALRAGGRNLKIDTQTFEVSIIETAPNKEVRP